MMRLWQPVLRRRVVRRCVSLSEVAMNRWIAAAFALTLSACNGCKGSPQSAGPLLDVAPAELAVQEVIIDWPPADSTVVGQWTAVTGWMERCRS